MGGRVLFLTQWFDPEPAMKGIGFVRGLIDQGLTVEVATGFPNYPSGRIAPGYTADLVHNSFVLSTKGRLDWQLGNLATIDLKVTYSKDVKGLIRFMGYENQVWHYSKCSETKIAFIMIHSVPLKDPFIFEIPVSTPSNVFWETKILKFGKPYEQILL